MFTQRGSVARHWSCFQFPPIINNAAIHILVRPRSGIPGPKGADSGSFVRISVEFLPDPKLKWPHSVTLTSHCYLLFPKGLIHDSDSWKDVFFSTCRKQKSIHTSLCQKGVVSVSKESGTVSLDCLAVSVAEILKYLLWSVNYAALRATNVPHHDHSSCPGPFPRASQTSPQCSKRSVTVLHSSEPYWLLSAQSTGC